MAATPSADLPMNRRIALPTLQEYQMVHAGQTHQQTERTVNLSRDVLAHLQ